MARLSLRNSDLILEYANNERLSRGERLVFFASSLPILPERRNNSYIFRRPEDTEQLVLSIREYLDKFNIICSLDESAHLLMQRAAQRNKECKDDSKLGEQIRTGNQPKVDLPEGFVRKLKPYQEQSVTHIVKIRHAANFSVPGSGKTTIVYASFAKLKALGYIQKIVVIGPFNSFMTWQDEYKACFGTLEARAVRLIGSKKRRQQLFHRRQDEELFLITYQSAQRDVAELRELLNRYKCLLVLDESHYIKKFEGGEWVKAVLQIAPFAKKRVILTGTPMPQGPRDLWSQFTFLYPGGELVGRPEQFIREIEVGSKNWDRKFKPFFMRIKKSALGLPKARCKIYKIAMSPHQRKIYTYMKERVKEELDLPPEDRQKLQAWRKAKIVRLLQVATNPSLLTKQSEEFQIPPLSGAGKPVLELINRYPKYEVPNKLLILEKLLNILIKKQDRKVIVWTVFVHNIQMLTQKLKSYRPLLIYGDIARDATENEEINREKHIKLFKEDPSRKLLIANPTACAESISLHNICQDAVYFDRTFNCGVFMQSKDRIHRIGLSPSAKVNYHILCSKDSIDEVVHNRLTDKEEAMLRLLNDDLPVLSMELDGSAISDDEEEKDFQAVVQHIKKS